MSRKRNAFTLVEMLVVLGIIVVLVALLVPVASLAVSTTRNFNMSAEIAKLAQAIESYKKTVGDYPPSMGEDYSPANRYLTVCEQHLQKCYPKMTAAEKTYFYDNIAPNIDGSEALVMWLRGTKKDARNPFTSATQEFNHHYAFEEDRLVDPDGDGFMSYCGEYSKSSPFVYFDARTYRLHLLATAAVLECQPAYRRLPTGVIAPVNPTSFQIFSSGQDGEFGQASDERKLFPDHILDVTGAPLPYEDADNMANFTEGKRLIDLRQ